MKFATKIACVFIFQCLQHKPIFANTLSQLFNAGSFDELIANYQHYNGLKVLKSLTAAC